MGRRREDEAAQVAAELHAATGLTWQPGIDIGERGGRSPCWRTQVAGFWVTVQRDRRLSGPDNWTATTTTPVLACASWYATPAEAVAALGRQFQALRGQVDAFVEAWPDGGGAR